MPTCVGDKAHRVLRFLLGLRSARVAAALAVWQWYLEWSQVARVAIDNRGLLRQLGFLRGTRDEVVKETEATETTKPVA